jgi:hypothetical protein
VGIPEYFSNSGEKTGARNAQLRVVEYSNSSGRNALRKLPVGNMTSFEEKRTGNLAVGEIQISVEIVPFRTEALQGVHQVSARRAQEEFWKMF